MNNSDSKASLGNILVVDDTPENLRLLVGMLKEKGYEVRPVLSGELAISGAQGFPPDLILLDILMPEMDGYEVCRQLKADERTRLIPIIFISAAGDVLDKVKAFALGGVDYITKPFQEAEVLARVENQLSLQKMQKELRQKNQELSQTLAELEATQNELIQSEKMAVLGQLVAGVAHEINNPLGAITASIRTIANFWNKQFLDFPVFFQKLSPERQADCLSLLERVTEPQVPLSTREHRKLKKSLISILQSSNIQNAATVANFLIELGIYHHLDDWMPLLRDLDGEVILKNTYKFATVKTSIESIVTASEKATKFVAALKTYAHRDINSSPVKANIIEGIETVLMIYKNQLKSGVNSIRNYDTSLGPILCYPDELNQVWTNLIHNALQAMDYRGTLTIEVQQEAKNVRVSISDTGKGIAPEIMPKIFQPFFTTKPPGEGSGLGLDIVKKIVEKHQGEITAESGMGKTTFTVLIPMRQQQEFENE